MIAVQFGRMLLALAFVLGLLWLCTRIGRSKQGRAAGRLGRMMGGSGGGGKIEVLSRRSLGRHTSVAVVRVGGKVMVVGQTPQQITVLSTVDEQDLELEDEPAPALVGRRRYRPSESPRLGMGNVEMVPGTAPQYGAETPRAWDAFVDNLRELTVRR